jgi:hypothetical protein
MTKLWWKPGAAEVEVGDEGAALGRKYPGMTGSVSRAHCKIKQIRGQWMLTDTESKNGTYVGVVVTTGEDEEDDVTQTADASMLSLSGGGDASMSGLHAAAQPQDIVFNILDEEGGPVQLTVRRVGEPVVLNLATDWVLLVSPSNTPPDMEPVHVRIRFLPRTEGGVRMDVRACRLGGLPEEEKEEKAAD